MNLWTNSVLIICFELHRMLLPRPLLLQKTSHEYFEFSNLFWSEGGRSKVNDGYGEKFFFESTINSLHSILLYLTFSLTTDSSKRDGKIPLNYMKNKATGFYLKKFIVTNFPVRCMNFRLKKMFTDRGLLYYSIKVHGWANSVKSQAEE